jgi:hypothetical protein
MTNDFMDGFCFAIRLVDEIGAKNWSYKQYIDALQRLSLEDKRFLGEWAREYLEDAGEKILTVDDLL